MYKQIKPLQPSGKMMVTPEQSEAVQKVLFEMGKKWIFDEDENHLHSWDKPFIFWDKAIIYITTLDLHNKHLFRADENPLHIFTDYFTTEPLK